MCALVTGVRTCALPISDGYTLLVVSGVPFVLNEAIYEDLAYDTQADFAPINVFAALPMVLVATALAVLQEGIEEFLQDQVELSGSRLAGWGHGLQALSELIHGDRDLAGETTGAGGICGLKRPIKVCSRSDEHTAELQSLMRRSNAVFCLKNKK